MNIPDLLRQIAAHLETAAPEKATEFWPDQSGVPTLPKVTGNLSIDFTDAMMGGAKPEGNRDPNTVDGPDRYHGPVSAVSLSAADAGYLWHRHHDYKLRVQRDLFTDLLNGTRFDINNAKQLGDRINPSMGAWIPDNPDLPALVAELFTRYEKGRIA